MLSQLLHDISVFSKAKLVNKSYNMLTSLVLLEVLLDCSLIKKEVTYSNLVMKAL
jgi:hypothetical protein